MHKFPVRTALGIALALVSAACDDSVPASPTAPTDQPVSVTAIDVGEPVRLVGPDELGDPDTHGVDGVGMGDVTLKATMPEPTSPVDGAQIRDVRVTLVTLNASAEFLDDVVPFAYRFELSDALMNVVHTGMAEQGADTTSYPVPLGLEHDHVYSWRVRAVLDGHNGPWSDSVTFRTPRASISPPVPRRPADGATDVWPVVLEVTNGRVSGRVGAIVMTFEVAADPAFGSLVASVRKAAGSERTSVRLEADLLEAEGTYHWQVIAGDDMGTSSDYSVSSSFTVSRATIAPPNPVQPANGAANVRAPVILLVENGTTRGPVGNVTMTFEIATDPAFGTIIETITQAAGRHAAGVVVQSAAQTSVQTTVELDVLTTYYWRVTARDRRGNASEPSEASFTTADATLDEIDPSQVTWLHPDSGDPNVVAGWPATSMITNITIDDTRPGGGICIWHTKANSWPGAPSKIGHPDLAGNPWIFAMVNGRWYAGTYEWLTPGEICKLNVPPGGCGPGCGHDRPSRELGPHVRVPPLDHTWVPRTGDLIGFMVSTMARHGPEGPLRERSNIVLRTWP